MHSLPLPSLFMFLINAFYFLIKENVDGYYCDQCKPRHFNLARENKRGCIQCFCNGLQEVSCRSSNLYYNKIVSNFNNNNDDWTIANARNDLKLPVTVLNGDNCIQFTSFDEYPQEELYFIAPPKFRGNKVNI
jgi:laminin, gamma 1